MSDNPPSSEPIVHSARQSWPREAPDGAQFLPHADGLLAVEEERDRARLRVEEQRQVIDALRATTARYRAQLSDLQSVLRDVDDASEERVEQLAALYLAVDEAEERAKEAEVRAARAETLLIAALQELGRRVSGNKLPEA